MAVAALSPSFAGVAGVGPLAARKVLLTATGLKDIGFFTVDAVRTWTLSSPAVFEVSALEASVSDPPLTLTSAELMTDSTFSVSGLTSSFSSLSALPFTRGASGVTSWLVVSVGFCSHVSKVSSRPPNPDRRTSSCSGDILDVAIGSEVASVAIIRLQKCLREIKELRMR